MSPPSSPAGWALTEVAPTTVPDAVFIGDTVVVYGDLAVICRPGALSRRAETAAVEVAVREQGYRVAHIEVPWHARRGSVSKWGGQVWVGRGGRTNAAGIEQLAGHLDEFAVSVVPVTTTRSSTSRARSVRSRTARSSATRPMSTPEHLPSFLAYCPGGRRPRRPPR